jgi:hypothetical protein
MIPNNAQERMLRKAEPPAAKMVDPSAGMVPYEEKDVEWWDFSCPNGPHQFMIEADKGDYVKEEKDRFKIRCRQDEMVISVCIYKGHIYHHSSYVARTRVRVTAEPQSAFQPTKKR